MIKFPAQLHAFRKTTLGDNLVTLSIDRMYSDQVVDIIRKEIGTQFIVYLEDVTSESNINKDSIELKDRFYRKMHVLIGEYAEISGVDKKMAKEEIKKILKDKKIIEKSTKELGIKKLAIVCNLIEELINSKWKN